MMDFNFRLKCETLEKTRKEVNFAMVVVWEELNL